MRSRASAMRAPTRPFRRRRADGPGPVQGGTMKTCGALLILLGIIAFVRAAYGYADHRTVLTGPSYMHVGTARHIPLPPGTGAAALVAGVILISVPPRSPM